MLTIWGRLNSHNVKKVAWLAREIDLPHQRIDIGGAFGFTDAYLEMNPNRMIPTIEDDGFVLWESNAILRYMAHRYAPHLLPDDPLVRAAGDKWMDWQFHFADAMRAAFLGLVREAEENRDAAAIDRSARAGGDMMRILDRELAQRPWLSGEDFGIADIPMGVYAHTFFTLDIPRPDLPRAGAWYDRLKARPGYRELVMIALS
ncbi:MAG: glutathione S-transferase family protein [Novosphingobium sp.]|nr:glutathione S-transferase family protein [Novosphingobium sp.]MCP5401123.1 glutathione S-transferase family protein [Novosphingobium sp.]